MARRESPGHSESAEERTPPDHKLPTWTLFFAVCSAGIGGTFQYGYNVSIINSPTEHIHKFLNETWQSRYHAELSPSLLTLLWSTIASIFSLGGLFGAHLGGSMAVYLGRKGALLMNNFVALMAAILMGVSFPTGLYELLIVGRFLIGVNTGIGLCVQPLYIGEAAPKHLRGAMAMGSSIFLTVGLLMGQIVGLRELLGGESHWPLLLSTCCIPAFLQLLALPWFPESPRFLFLDKGNEMKCLKALKRFHGHQHYQREMDDIERELYTTGSEKAKKPWELFRDRSIRWQLITIICMTTGQQLSGINAIYFYTSYIFKEAGIPDEKILYATLGTGACECLTALTCGLLIESTGRKALILGGYSLMCLWCLMMTFSLTYQDLCRKAASIVHDTAGCPGRRQELIWLVLAGCTEKMVATPSLPCAFFLDLLVGSLPEHGLCLRLHHELRSWTRWGDQHPNHRTLHPILAACCLHDRWIYELAEFLHRWDALSVYRAGPEAILLPGLLRGVLPGGSLYYLCHSGDKEQELCGDQAGIPQAQLRKTKGDGQRARREAASQQ